MGVFLGAYASFASFSVRASSKVGEASMATDGDLLTFEGMIDNGRESKMRLDLFEVGGGLCYGSECGLALVIRPPELLNLLRSGDFFRCVLTGRWRGLAFLRTWGVDGNAGTSRLW